MLRVIALAATCRSVPACSDFSRALCCIAFLVFHRCVPSAMMRSARVLICLLSCAAATRHLRNKGAAGAVDKLADLLSEATEANKMPEPKEEPALDATAATSPESKDAVDSFLVPDVLSLRCLPACNASVSSRSFGRMRGSSSALPAAPSAPRDFKQNMVGAPSGLSLHSCCRLTPEEKSIEEAVAAAMQTPPTIGKADRTMPSAAKACEPDFSACPLNTEKKGAVCVATESYTGPCASEMPVLSMTPEQAFAFSRACKVTFPCAAAEKSASFLSLPVGYLDLPAEAVMVASLVSVSFAPA